eukprot:4171252-Amphidinium_carterae.1
MQSLTPAHSIHGRFRRDRAELVSFGVQSSLGPPAPARSKADATVSSKTPLGEAESPPPKHKPEDTHLTMHYFRALGVSLLSIRRWGYESRIL